MKRITASLLALGLLVAVGCNTSAPGGKTGPTTGPGAPTGNAAERAGEAVKRTFGGTPAGTFKISGPVTDVNLKPGETKEEKLTVSRGDGSTQTFKLSAEGAPAGVKVEFDPATVAPAVKDVVMKVHADDKAPQGKHTVTVKATPDSGEPTSIQVTIDVKAK